LISGDANAAYPYFGGMNRAAAFLLATAVLAAVADLTMVFAAGEGQGEKDGRADGERHGHGACHKDGAPYRVEPSEHGTPDSLAGAMRWQEGCIG
jgi:hypothetical protein